MTYPFGRDEWLARAAAISAREYLFGYLSSHIPGDAMHTLRKRHMETQMVQAVLDGSSVKAAMNRPDESAIDEGLLDALQRIAEYPISRADELNIESAREIARAAIARALPVTKA